MGTDKLVWRLEMVIPVRLDSIANDSSHWRFKNARKIAQQQEITVELSNALKGAQVQMPCRITLTRIGPKALDPDNLVASFKGAQDAIARKIGADDGDLSKVHWSYLQDPIRTRKYAMRILIESVPGSLPLL